MLFSVRIAPRTGAVRASRAGRHRPPLFTELQLQHSFAVRRLATFGALVSAACALACYQDKPPQPSKGAQSAPGAPSSTADAQLGLQPVPATHDTAIREIDQFQLTQERLQHWMAAKRALDVIHSTDPAVEAHMREGARPKTIDEAAKRFDSEPKLHAALQQAGTNGKDFLLTSIAMQQAMKGFQLKAMGKLDASKVPPVIMGNINFVGSHMTDIMGMVTGGLPQRPAPRTP